MPDPQGVWSLVGTDDGTTRTQEAEISDKRLVGDLYAHPTILRIPLRATATIQGAAFLTGIFWLLFGMALSG
jgi:hypothetical protein